MEKKNSFINKNKIILQESIRLVRDNPLIYTIGLLLAFVHLPTVLSFSLFPEHSGYQVIFGWMSAIFGIVFFGWFAVEIDFLNQAYTKGKVEYKNFWKLLFKYFFKVFIVLFLYTYTSIALFMIFMLFSSTDFGVGTGIDKIATEYFLSSIGVKQSLHFSIFNQIRLFLLTLWSFYLLQIIIEVVVAQKKVLKSFISSLKYLYRNIFFFLILAIIHFLIRHLFDFILEFISIFEVKEIIQTSVSILLGLFINAVLIVNYHKKKKKLKNK